MNKHEPTWYSLRMQNYCNKLQITKHKARRNICYARNGRKEYDRIVDSKYRSDKEPGISHEERQERAKSIASHEKKLSITINIENIDTTVTPAQVLQAVTEALQENAEKVHKNLVQRRLKKMELLAWHCAFSIQVKREKPIKRVFIINQ